MTETLSDADVAAALDALAGGWLTMGPRIQALEQAFGERLGVPHAIAVSSGTAALHLACLAAGAGPGASVVVSALAPAGTVNAPRYTGARPIPADAGDDPARAAQPDTGVVIASHLGGAPVDAGALRTVCEARSWILVEDVTEALGAELPDGRWAGTAGHLGCFSLAAGRVLGVGEGGMVVTGDEALAARVRSLRSHAMTSVTWDRHRGHADSYDVVDLGFNFRMDEPRAALALSRLTGLSDLVARRRRMAAGIEEAGATIAWSPEILARSSPHAVPVLVDDPGRLARALADRGVAARSWGDRFGPGLAPAADALRARSLLVDLAGVESPEALTAAVAAALAG